MPFFSNNCIKIAGISCVIPKNIIETNTFKNQFGIPEVDKFIEMTGIKQTRWVSKKQTASDLCTVAAKNLIKNKSLNPKEIKALVYAGHSPDYRRPATALVIHKQLDMSTETAAFDISLGCSSAVYGIQMLASMMINSDIDKAILVLGDTASKTTNPRDRASIMLVGDAGAAVYLEKNKNFKKPIKTLLRSDGNGYRYLIVPAGGYRNLNAKNDENLCNDGNFRSLHNSFMQGTSVFTFTISDVPKAIKDFLNLTNSKIENYDLFAFHQANLLILKKIIKKLKIPIEKVPLTLPLYGNTSGPSSLLSICEFYSNFQNRSFNVMMVGFGVGISWGVISFEINSDDIFPILESDYFFEEGFINSVTEL